MSINGTKFCQYKKCTWNANYPKNSKTICDLQDSLLIHKMFADSKNDNAFSKSLLNQKNVCEFQKLFHQTIPKERSSILEMFAYSRKNI